MAADQISRMHALLEKSVLAPLSVIVLMQSVIVMSTYGIPVVAPDAAGDIGIPPEWIGYLFATIYAAASLSGLLSGRMVAVWGPTWSFRALMVAVVLGSIALIGAHPLLAFLSAALLGLATGPMNPVGSFVLVRISPPGWQALIFSLKQCATPAGGMLAGLILPPLAVLWGWQAAFAVVPLLAVLFFLAAGYGDLGGPRRPAPAGSPARPAGGGMLDSLRLAVAGRQIAATAVAGMLFAGSQVALLAYLVVYLWQEAGMSTTEAGFAFALINVTGIAARIGLGWLAERHVETAILLFVSAAGMGLGVICIAYFSAAWPLWIMYAVIAVTGAFGNGWVGLLFAELARLAPDGHTAEAAGGGQVFMYGGVFLTPLACGAALESTGRYGALFTLLAGLAFVAAAVLLWGRAGSANPAAR
jgi:MFS family permease